MLGNCGDYSPSTPHSLIHLVEDQFIPAASPGANAKNPSILFAVKPQHPHNESFSNSLLQSGHIFINKINLIVNRNFISHKLYQSTPSGICFPARINFPKERK
jgi:hypothetical protein